MLKIFMILIILLGFITIYLEIKNRERSDKIFYTFYLFIMSTIILPFIGIFDNLIAYIIYFSIYSFMLYGIYTDFSFFLKLNEFFLEGKKIDSKNYLKIDHEFIEFIKQYYYNVLNTYHLNIYTKYEKIINVVILATGFVVVLISLYYVITK